MKQYYWPPKLFLRFFRWFCHPKLRDHIEGDLLEYYNQQMTESGKIRADINFIVDILLLFRPGIIKPAEGYKNLDNYGMIKSYFKIGWRNIARQKLYSTINVMGLTLGICASVVIYTISSYELSFDIFHPDRERIYRVIGDITESNGDKLHFSRLPIPLFQSARTQLVGTEAIAGLIPYEAKIKINEVNNANEFESRITGTHYVTTVIADQQYFEIFKYEWLAGNATQALQAPLSVVLTESRASKYFGSLPLDKIIGKQIVYDDSLTVSVTGVIKDWSGNTDLAFTDFISFNALQTDFLKNRINSGSWKQGDMACWIFAKLSEYGTSQAVNALFEKITKPHASEIKLTAWLESLSGMHFNANVIENPIRTAHLPTLYSLMGIAIFILLLAIINFVNLSTAQSIQRAKEVGVRKVLGSSRMSLSFQFLTETFLLTMIASLLGILLVDPVLNEFKSFIPTGISLHLLKPQTIIFLTLVVLVTTLLSGFYPSLVLSSYRPALSLRGVGAKTGNEKWMLRKGLIVLQFSVSLVFITGSIVISKQLNYTQEKDFGFNADAIMIVETPWGSQREKITRLDERVKLIPGVSNVALQWVAPMVLNGRGRYIKFKSTDEKAIDVTQVAGNEDFIPLYQIKILAGRNLAHADSLKEFVINEKLARLMGCKKPEDALGRMLYWDNKPYPVVGVVADFHSRSFHEIISPLCIVNRPDREGTLAIKLFSKSNQSDLKTTLARIESAWSEIFPAATFQYTFYDDSLALMYESDQRTATLVNTSTAITIFISCIGLFGVTLFTSEKRSKEISIRKILGASIANIVIMLSKGFVLLVIIALLIASPVAMYLMNQWLQKFAYHININWSVFVLAGVSSLVLTIITVSYQSIKAALTSPVNNLRSE